MNLYYRGYLIHEDIRSICYTIYGRRPQRSAMTTTSNCTAAMQWVDRQTHRSSTEPGLPELRPVLTWG